MSESAAEELAPGVTRAFSVFTGETESDPHRVGFWAVQVTAAGLTLGPAEGPERERETASASWAELHAMLGQRAALADDLVQLRYDVRWEADELVRLRVKARRLRALIEARELLLNGEAPREAPGILPLQRSADGHGAP